MKWQMERSINKPRESVSPCLRFPFKTPLCASRTKQLSESGESWRGLLSWRHCSLQRGKSHRHKDTTNKLKNCSRYRGESMQTVPGKKYSRCQRTRRAESRCPMSPPSHQGEEPDVPLRFPSARFAVTARVCRSGRTELQTTEPLNTALASRERDTLLLLGII